MYEVKFSTLSYYPDLFLKSNLAVGVAFQIVGPYNEFHNIVKLIPKKTKIASFDDEIDLDFVNMFLDGVKDEFENYHFDRIEQYIVTFVNNFKFEELQSKIFTTLSAAKKFVEVTHKYILHLGIDKEKRLNEVEKKAYIANFLENKYDNLKRKHSISGKYALDTFSPDFTVEDESGQIISYKLINKSRQAVHNSKSYLMHALLNKHKVVFILEDEMENEINTLRSIIKDLELDTKVIAEKELQKL